MPCPLPDMSKVFSPGWTGKQQGNVLMQVFLIVLNYEEVISATADDLLTDLSLAIEGITSEHLA